MNAHMDADELAALRAELARLKAREQDLLERNTQLVLEARGLRVALEMARQDRPIALRSDDLAEFFSIANHEARRYPSVPDTEVVRLHLRLMFEEFFELLRACLDPQAATVEIAENARRIVTELIGEVDSRGVNLVEFVDGCIDSAYTIEGALLGFGVDSQRVWDLVHAANMAKRGGPFVNGKLKRPDGWNPPDVAGELERQRKAVGA